MRIFVAHIEQNFQNSIAQIHTNFASFTAINQKELMLNNLRTQTFSFSPKYSYDFFKINNVTVFS